MGEAIERAVRALDTALAEEPYRLVPATGPKAGAFGLNLEAIVRVVVEAMREPTREMRKVGDHLMDEVVFAGIIWEAMIDEALRDE